MTQPILIPVEGGCRARRDRRAARRAAGPASAFCGFYVAKADAKLFNKSSKVVLARDGQQTAITMASDYEGEPKEFAAGGPGADLHRRKTRSASSTPRPSIISTPIPRRGWSNITTPIRASAASSRWPWLRSPRRRRRCGPVRCRNVSRRQGRGAVRRRRVRRLDPVGRGERRADQLADRQRLQDSAQAPSR